MTEAPADSGNLTRNIALVGDVGGTNARLALADLSGERPMISEVRDFPSRNYNSLGDVMRAYLGGLSGAHPDIASIAVAGPVTHGTVHFTNLGWTLSEADIKAMGFAEAHLLNDFEAQALATPYLDAGAVRILGPAIAGEAEATVAVMGPGTGLGGSALVRGRGHAIALATEGGHASFAPCDDVEREILRLLSAKFGRVSIERVLSGPGLQNLHDALNTIEAQPAGAAILSDEITRRGVAGEAPFLRTLERFCAILGTVAGDFALIYGARGGVFIAGGIAPAIWPVLEKSRFRERFEAKGRFQSYVSAIPTRVIVHPHTAFLGAASLAKRLLAQG